MRGIARQLITNQNVKCTEVHNHLMSVDSDFQCIDILTYFCKNLDSDAEIDSRNDYLSSDDPCLKTDGDQEVDSCDSEKDGYLKGVTEVSDSRSSFLQILHITLQRPYTKRGHSL